MESQNRLEDRELEYAFMGETGGFLAAFVVVHLSGASATVPVLGIQISHALGGLTVWSFLVTLMFVAAGNQMERQQSEVQS